MTVAHWFTVLGALIPHFKHHLLSLNPPSGSLGVSPSERAILRGRSMICRSLKVFPIEVIVRGYITGSAFEESVGPSLKGNLYTALNLLTIVGV